MSAIGIGFSLVPIECARWELDAGLVKPVSVKAKLPVNAFVTTYAVGQHEPALEAFISILREVAVNLLSNSPSPFKPS